jgi:hypothetical protein
MSNAKVVVTTEHRGVFFGTLEQEEGNIVTLSDARNILYWGKLTRGFLGLASKGPQSDSRVGPKAPRLKVRKVTAIAECSEEAVKAWEGEPWDA